MDTGNDNDRPVRHLILTPGRTGSSLLASYMDDAGANFGLKSEADWDPGFGAYEHPDIHKSAVYFANAFALSPIKPTQTITKWRWDYLRSMGKKTLKRALRHVEVVKFDDLDLLVPIVVRLGYRPSIVINYRNFFDQAKSLYQRESHGTVQRYADEYIRIYRNGLLALHLYGGCTVSFEELTDPSQTAWASALGATCGLSPEALLNSRAKRAKKLSKKTEFEPPILVPETARMEDLLRNLAGQVIPISSQAKRSLGL